MNHTIRFEVHIPRRKKHSLRFSHQDLDEALTVVAKTPGSKVFRVEYLRELIYENPQKATS